MSNVAKPILVTGGHRSGSTWAGRMISAAPGVGYIHEPFNIGENITPNPSPFVRWFQYIESGTAGEYEEVFQQILSYQYPLSQNISRLNNVKDIALILNDQINSSVNHILKRRPLIKDPIALFSAEWLCDRYDMDVLCMIRHPAAFCSSLKIKSWHFDFNNFLSQPLLMDKYLHPFREQLEEYALMNPGIVEQGVLLWNCIHHTIDLYRDKHADWLFIRHEDLSAEPVKVFQSIYERLGLNFTRRVRNRIVKSSGAHNPVEVLSGNELTRNSVANINNWKTRLTQEEISLIRAGTREVACLFYKDDEW